MPKRCYKVPAYWRNLKSPRDTATRLVPRCGKCGFKIRSPNHDEGSHHKTGRTHA